MVFEGSAVAERDVEAGERGLGREADELGSAATGAWRATAATTSAAVTRVWSSMLVETWMASPACRPSARRPGRPSLPPSRMAAAIRLASSSVAGGSSSTLNATSGGRAATSVAPAVGCRLRRAVVGPQAGERAGRAQARARAPARERAVQVDRELQVAAEPVGEQQRLRHRGAALGVGAVDDRGDVDDPDARVDAGVRGQVDPLDRLARALQQRLVQRARARRRA